MVKLNLLAQFLSAHSPMDEDRLLKNLTTRFDKSIRPVLNTSHAIDIAFDITFNYIIDVVSPKKYLYAFHSFRKRDEAVGTTLVSPDNDLQTVTSNFVIRSFSCLIFLVHVAKRSLISFYLHILYQTVLSEGIFKTGQTSVQHSNKTVIWFWKVVFRNIPPESSLGKKNNISFNQSTGYNVDNSNNPS